MTAVLRLLGLATEDGEDLETPDAEGYRLLAGSGIDALNQCKFLLSKISFGYDNLLLWLSLLGVASALLESYLHRLERKYATQKTYLRFLRQTYKELVILGFLSFLLILLRDFYPNMTKNSFLIIEMAHLWLFSVGIAFIFVAVQISTGLMSSKRRWDTAFTHGLQVIEAEYKGYFDGRGLLMYLICAMPAFFRADLLHEQVKLWILRKQFIKANHMPTTFDFPKYLRKTLTINMLKGVEIGWQSWSVLCTLFFIGYVITVVLDKGDGVLNSDVAAIGCVSVTLFIILVSSRLGAALKGGANRYFRLLGCDRPHDFETLLSFAKGLHHAEERQHRSRVLNGFTHDDLRLQQILRECRNNLLMSETDIITKNSVFGGSHSGNAFEKHMPLFSPTAFIICLRIIVLIQCYVVGLLIVLCLGHSQYTGLFIGLLVVEIVLHLFLMGSILPDMIRSFTLMGSVLILDETALDRIEDTFQFQTSTNMAIFQLGQLLVKSYQRCAFELFPTAMPILDAEAQTRVIDQVFQELSSRGSKRVGSHLLSKRLEGRMRPRRIKLVFRALNTPGGFTVDECRFLIKGMLVVNAEYEDVERNLELCFGSSVVRCGLCGAAVSTDDIREHATTLCTKLPEPTNTHVASTIPSPMPAIRDLLERLVGEEGILVTTTRYGLLQPQFDKDLWPDSDDSSYNGSIGKADTPSHLSFSRFNSSLDVDADFD